MPELTAAQVHILLTATEEYVHSAQEVVKTRSRLDRVLLDTACEARVGLRELAALTGLHHAAIRAGIRRAVGRGRPGGWSQPTLAEADAPQPTHAHPPPLRPSSVMPAHSPLTTTSTSLSL
jgi:hypothetical protein